MQRCRIRWCLGLNDENCSSFNGHFRLWINNIRIVSQMETRASLNIYYILSFWMIISTFFKFVLYPFSLLCQLHELPVCWWRLWHEVKRQIPFIWCCDQQQTTLFGLMLLNCRFEAGAVSLVKALLCFVWRDLKRFSAVSCSVSCSVVYSSLYTF